MMTKSMVLRIPVQKRPYFGEIRKRFLNFNRYRTEKKFAGGLCVPFVEISLRTSFYSASHFSTEIRAREFAWALSRHTVLYRITARGALITPGPGNVDDIK